MRLLENSVRTASWVLKMLLKVAGAGSSESVTAATRLATYMRSIPE
jgi:hypothetical protein